MSDYVVTARKWRPGLFEDIIGQGHVTRTLSNALSSGRVAHAYLFSGPRGVGKTTAARIMAKGLNCEKGPVPAPCNSCSSCKAVASGSSVDVFEIDGASNNGVENVRELREGIRFVPGEARYKVYIIDEVHMLSGAAFNALLKTLEEPPPHAVFILATTEAHKIPLTILSRCQRFDFKRIPFKDIQGHLEKILTAEGIKFEPEALFTIAREADGSLRDAQSLLDQVIAFAGAGGDEEGAVTGAHATEALGLMDREILFDLSSAVIEKNAGACLNVVEKMHDFGYDLKKGLGLYLEHIRDLTVIKSTGSGEFLELSGGDLERFKALSAKASVERLYMLFGIISKGYEDIGRSAHPRHVLEIALLKAAHFDCAGPVDSLIERLERLGAKIGQGAVAAAAPRAPQSAEEAAPQSAYQTVRITSVKPKEPVKERPSAVVSKASEESAAYAAEPALARFKRGDELGQESPEGQDSLVDFIRKKIRTLDEAVRSSIVNVRQDDVEFTVPEEKLGIFKMNIENKKLEAACNEYFKRRMRLVVKSSGGASPAADKKNGADPLQGAEPLQGADPLIKEALSVFGGRVI
ncbi:MAG: DNA polymerase III subunit gamma/tau [Deltaproteobacteria bacterium]|nr:DNA polymerase III subunit gamma/tau [Deltaproteobacteria bacterium]